MVDVQIQFVGRNRAHRDLGWGAPTLVNEKAGVGHPSVAHQTHWPKNGADLAEHSSQVVDSRQWLRLSFRQTMTPQVHADNAKALTGHLRSDGDPSVEICVEIVDEDDWRAIDGELMPPKHQARFQGYGDGDRAGWHLGTQATNGCGLKQRSGRPALTSSSGRSCQQRDSA